MWFWDIGQNSNLRRLSTVIRHSGYRLTLSVSVGHIVAGIVQGSRTFPPDISSLEIDKERTLLKIEAGLIKEFFKNWKLDSAMKIT